MDTICNRLSKLTPPPFITTPVSDKQRKKKNFSISWPLSKINYNSYSDNLEAEVQLLTQFIQRKGRQLRLEKALLLTKQISKVASRWISNEFDSQLIKFQNGFPNSKNQNTTPKSKSRKNSSINASENDENVLRLPSYQWLQWIIYLVLREGALLAKIKLECENTIHYWFGLISSSHHWGDSLVVCSIIARIWHLSSVMVQELNTEIYPFLLKLSKSLEPTSMSSPWPDSTLKWEIPTSSLVEWLEDSMRLPFEPANMNRTLSSIVKSKGASLSSILDNSAFSANTDFDDSAILDNEEVEPELSLSTETEIEPEGAVVIIDEDEDEDFGTIVQPSTTNMTKTCKKNKGKLKNKNTKKKPKINNETKHGRLKSTTLNTPSKKEFKLRWKKVFKNYQTQLTNLKGRKQLLSRIKKFKNDDISCKSFKSDLINSKIKLKLVKLAKVIRNYSDVGGHENDYNKCLNMYQNFDSFVQKKLTNNKSKRK